MSINKIEHRASDLPADLPPLDRVVQHCADAGYRQNGTYFAVELGIPRFWIKYGTSITLGEALTQDQVAQIVNADPTSVVRVPQVYLVLRERCRYIVMQYIAGDTVARRQPSPSRYAKGDVAAVAAAFKQLIDLRVPASTPPGHVGGGPIGHDFFVECKSTSEYPTVGDLQAQVNKLVAAQGLRVDYSGEIAQGLVLCPSDIDPSNFIVDPKGKLFAIDFGRTGYMPPSYVSYSLEQPKLFTKKVARLVEYPKSANLLAMQVAAGALVLSGNNSLGIDRKL